jgi:hypothetical protein
MTLSTHPSIQPSVRVPAISARRVSLATEAVVAAYISDLAAGAVSTGATGSGQPAPATGPARLRDGHAVRVGSRDRRPASRGRASRVDGVRRALATT